MTASHLDPRLTERRNPRTADIDLASPREIVDLLHAEDRFVLDAVATQRDAIARAIELVEQAFRAGGRLFYVGAGTSGRLAAMDADELGPTYGLEPGRWTAYVAAYDGTVDGEDDTTAGRDIGALAGPGDVLVGVTASGRTPFAIAALGEARSRGAGTILLSGNPSAAAGSEVDVHVAIHTGPEAVTGSTRLKAGTAQKLALNALSTATMVRCGRTWSNLMVGAVATNSKLRGRIAAALETATGEDPDACRKAVDEADGDGRVALLTLLAQVPSSVAQRALQQTGGHVREALTALHGASA